MNIKVVYRSRTGFTKRYAGWISEALSCEAVDIRKFNRTVAAEADLIIYGCRVHAGFLDGIKKIRKLADDGACGLIVFATGASPADPAILDEMWKNNKLDSSVPHFYFQSGLCYENMGFFDKTLMKMLSKMLSGKKNATESELEMAKAISSSYDMSSVEQTAPLIEYVRTLKH